MKPIHTLVCCYKKQLKMKKLITIGLFIAATLFAGPKIYAQVSVGVSISANIAPPAIPDYDQPPCPVDGYLWQPGYWAYDRYSGGYYWVPGVWVAPPTVGYLWTPSYWGYSSGVYVYHAGYWGPHVGFYGGINYGYGYFGSGFAGGGWQGGRFRYNTAVVHVNTTVVRNTYVDRTVIRNTTVNNRVSYNGGRGGVTARPNAQQQQAMRERHVQATSAQINHQQAASKNRSQFASVNHGRPSVTAASRVNNHANNPAPNRQPNSTAHTRPTDNNRATKQHAQQQRAQTQQHAQQQERAQQQRAQSQQQHAQQQRSQMQQQQRAEQNQAQQQQRAQQQHAQQRAQMQPQQRSQPQHMQAQHVSQPHGNPSKEPQRHR